jgi:hypothetical protein
MTVAGAISLAPIRRQVALATENRWIAIPVLLGLGTFWAIFVPEQPAKYSKHPHVTPEAVLGGIAVGVALLVLCILRAYRIRLVVDSDAGTIVVHNFWRRRTLPAAAIPKVSWNTYTVRTQDTRYTWDTSVYNCLYISRKGSDGKERRPIRVYATIGKVKDLSVEQAVVKFCTSHSIPYDASEPDESPAPPSAPADFAAGALTDVAPGTATSTPWWSESGTSTGVTALGGASSAPVTPDTSAVPTGDPTPAPNPASAADAAPAAWPVSISATSVVSLAPNRSEVHKDFAGGNAFLSFLAGAVVWLPLAIIFQAPGSTNPAPIALPIAILVGVGTFAFFTWRVSTIDSASTHPTRRSSSATSSRPTGSPRARSPRPGPRPTDEGPATRRTRTPACTSS